MAHLVVRPLGASFLATLALSLCGCLGKSQQEVTGRVTYNGKPLARPSGEIIFVGPDGSQVAAAIAMDGTYKATQVKAGLNRIAVYYRNPDFGTGKRHANVVHAPGASAPLPESPFLTPARYASLETSGLSVQVEKGTVFQVDLTGPLLP